MYKADGTYIRTICASNMGSTQTGTVTELTGDEAYHQAFIQAVGTTVGQTVTDVVLSPQLEAGSTATAFEPYRDVPFISIDNGAGQIGSVAVEAGCRARQETRKNLLKPPGDATVGGVTYTLQDNGTYLANGTVANMGLLSLYKGVLPPGQYTISGGAGGLQVSLAVYKADGAYIRTICASNMGSTQTGTVTELTGDEAYHQAFIQANPSTAGQTINNVTLAPQLEAGGTATVFEPYKSTLPITGRESVEIAACGKNLLKPQGNATVSGVTYTLQSDGTYLANGTVTATGTLYLYKGVLPPGQYTISGGAGGIQVSLSVYKADGTYIRTICTSYNGASATGTVTELTGEEAYHQAFIQALSSTVGQTVTNVVLSPQLEAGGAATAFESYRSTGGGTVTPTEPLYGLPGAEDTVEASVDGDVLVTRRTAVLELDGTETNIVVVEPSSNHARLRITPAKAAKPAETTRTLGKALCSHYKTVSTGAQWNDAAEGVGVETNGTILIFDARFTTLEAWKTYLAAQAAAGTPVTIVYELAVPETEALTAISPITPEAGPVNIWTNADALTATVRGSGWEIINDTDDLSEGIDGLLDNVGSLTGALDSTQAQLTDLAAVTITRGEVESIVTSVDGRLSSVEQQAGALDVVVAEMRGDVDNIMLGVHVGTGGVGIYRDGDPYQINIDNRGMTVTEGGMETLSARESQVNANRMQVREALMLGSELALVVSPGKLRLQRR